MLGLEELLQRRPAALSGGQRQRVAMGRAIVREPRAFLMDEPLSNLDAKLRVDMRAQLARLHAELKVTTVYVTHDQVEAMTLGQRVAVMRDGQIQQVDRPQQLYKRPANLFVAAFIGSPPMNLVEGEVSDGAVEFAGIRVPVSGVDPGRVILGIRPQDLSIATDASLPSLEVEPAVIEELGSSTQAIFHIDAPPVDTEAIRPTTAIRRSCSPPSVARSSPPHSRRTRRSRSGSPCASRSAPTASTSSTRTRARGSTEPPYWPDDAGEHVAALPDRRARRRGRPVGRRQPPPLALRRVGQLRRLPLLDRDLRALAPDGPRRAPC